MCFVLEAKHIIVLLNWLCGDTGDPRSDDREDSLKKGV